MKSSLLVLVSAIHCTIALTLNTTAFNNTIHKTNNLNARQTNVVDVKAACVSWENETPPMPSLSDVRSLATPLINRGTANCTLERNPGTTGAAYTNQARSSKAEINIYFSDRPGTTPVFKVIYDCKTLGNYVNKLAGMCNEPGTDKIAGKLRNVGGIWGQN